MTISTVLPRSGCDNSLDRLPYFVDWRPRLWTPAVRWLLGDPARFRGKKVLELGSRTGRMSCLFVSLGAEVLGVDLPRVCLDSARRETAALGVSDRVHFVNYSDDPTSIPDGDFVFVFSKSVFVLVADVKQLRTALSAKMKPSAELFLAENLAGGA
jgi:2-polyprenyl-3-methyl-5-hydroxy-6-metoxy-1,4-benzoquinol methylase